MFLHQKVLVTGGTGFIGSHLVERLVGAGAKVTITRHASDLPFSRKDNLGAVRQPLGVAAIDLTCEDPADLICHGGFAYVFHLAASADIAASVADPKLDFGQNALSTLALVEAIGAHSPQTRLVYTSSALVYGDAYEPVSEDHPTAPKTPYAVSKLAAEDIVRGSGLNCAVLRLFSTYGPRLRKQIVFDVMTRLRQDPHRLVLRGDGGQVRDLNFVSNVVDALCLVAAEAPMLGETYNVGFGKPYTIREVAEAVARVMRVRPEIRFDRDSKPGDTPWVVPDMTRLRALGYRAVVPLEVGLHRTWQWVNFQPVPQAA